MNTNKQLKKHTEIGTGFRPQQGLSIMNEITGIFLRAIIKYLFPSPTGVKYYESLPTKP